MIAWPLLEGLTPEYVLEMLPSGRQPVLASRVSWAVMHMERAGLLERTKRGVYRLMPEGERLLSRMPSRIDMNLLRENPGYAEWIKRAQTPSSNKEAASGQADNLKDTPEEALDRAAEQLRSALSKRTSCNGFAIQLPRSLRGASSTC